MALPKSTHAALRPQAPESAGSTSINEPTAPPRVTLPRNLSATLQGLEDFELETLQRAVGTGSTISETILCRPIHKIAWNTDTADSIIVEAVLGAEIKRRGRAGLDVEFPEPKAVVPTKASDAKMPAGKANLIRASFQTGMKTSAIARSLRVSLTVVNQVLGTQVKPRR